MDRDIVEFSIDAKVQIFSRFKTEEETEEFSETREAVLCSPKGKTCLTIMKAQELQAEAVNVLGTLTAREDDLPF